MRRALALLILTLVGAVPADAQEASRYAASHEWFARDKALHFGISGVGTTGLFVTGVELGLPRWQAATAATLVVGAAGVWREIGTNDRQNLVTRNKLSRRDLVWDAVGIATGLAVTELYYRVRGRDRERQSGTMAVRR